MRLPKIDIRTESHGVISSTKFGINNEDMGLILNILRTKIYKNPVLAVCREISCNSRDAHREVQDDLSNPTTTETPIEIYLPNDAEPTIKFKDFGPGIGPERKDIFVKFGASTKRDDDNQLGVYGIGCKSPWSYGASFTVDTIANAPSGHTKPRVRYVYHVYIDESQVGAMDLMLCEETDEPNSTSIIIPVKNDDFYKFADTVIECTKHWDVKPKLFGGNPDARPTYPIFKELYRGTGWVMYTKGVTYPCAIVDGIEYAIDKYSLSDKTELQREMLRHGFCMEFGIGELTLTANRDHLHYDNATIKKILDRVDNIAAEIKDKIIDSINNVPSYFEACNLYREIKDQIPGVVSNLKGLAWNGHKLRVTCNIKDIGTWAKVVGYSANYDQVLVERSNRKLYFNDPKVMLIHNDKTRHLSKHVVLWLLKEFKDIKTIQVIYTPDIPTSSDFKSAIEKYGSVNGVNVAYDTVLLNLLQPVKYSTIQVPKAKYLPKASGGGDGRSLLEDGNINGYTLYSEYSRGMSRLKATTAQFPRDEGGVYVVYNYKERSFSSETKKLTYQTWRTARDLLGEDIVGLSNRRVEMIVNNPNWIPLDSAMAKLFLPYQQKMSGDDLDHLMRQARFANNRKMTRFSLRLGEVEYKQSPLILWAKMSKELIDKAEEFLPALNLYHWFGYKMYDYKSYVTNDGNDGTDGKIVELYTEIKNRYPLLTFVRANTVSVIDSLIEYINLLDKDKLETRVEDLLTNLSIANDSISTTDIDTN